MVGEHPGAEVQVWAEDEARFGRIPSYRRIWALKGWRPRASSRRRYEGGYLFGFVRPQTGETYNIVGPSVSAEAMTAVLRQFAADVGAVPKKRVVLVLDGAGRHEAKDLEVPVGIHLVFLPPYAPELQPAERLWPLINEVVANRTFMTLAKLIETVSQRCVILEQNPDLVSALTRYP